jgi:hypothetical protein
MICGQKNYFGMDMFKEWMKKDYLKNVKWIAYLLEERKQEDQNKMEWRRI